MAVDRISDSSQAEFCDDSRSQIAVRLPRESMWNTDVFHRKVHLYKLWDTGNELISVLIFRPSQTLKIKALPSPILLKIIQSFLGLTGSILEFFNTVFRSWLSERRGFTSSVEDWSVHFISSYCSDKNCWLLRSSLISMMSLVRALLLSRVSRTSLSFPTSSFTFCLVAIAEDVLRVPTAIINSVTDDTFYQI